MKTFEMKLAELVPDKSKKPKEKIKAICNQLLDGSVTSGELLEYAEKAGTKEKGICIEAVEWATRSNPGLASEKVFAFATKMLKENTPKLKWESARVVANTAHLHQGKLQKPITHLLANTEHSGTVVRWAAALALGEILKLRTKYNKNLLPALQAISNREQESGVRKKYLDAIKKVADQ